MNKSALLCVCRCARRGQAIPILSKECEGWGTQTMVAEKVKVLTGDFRLLGDHNCSRHAPIIEENAFEPVLVIAGVHQDQESFRTNLVMQQLDGRFRNSQLPQSIGEIDFCERRLLLIGCCCILAAG